MPLVGTGTDSDPRRPDHAPILQPGVTPTIQGILAYTYQTSDDGKYALVEFVARDRSALKDILADQRPGVRVFERGKSKPSDIEQEFKKVKKNFDLNTFGTIVP